MAAPRKLRCIRSYLAARLLHVPCNITANPETRKTLNPNCGTIGCRNPFPSPNRRPKLRTGLRTSGYTRSLFRVLGFRVLEIRVEGLLGGSGGIPE